MRRIFVGTSFDTRMLQSPNAASRVRMAMIPYERVIKLLNGALRQLIVIAPTQKDAVEFAQAIPMPTAQGITYTGATEKLLDQGDILLASARPGNHNEWFIVDILKDVQYAMTLDTTLEEEINELYKILERVDGPIVQAPSVLRYRDYNDLAKRVEAALDITVEDAAKVFIETRNKRRSALYRDQFICVMAMARHWR